MKVEAVDVANNIICVATIINLKPNQIKIRFDGWGKTYDTWMKVESNNIHPVGWCEEMEKTLCPPKGKFI